jgi:hypothetical protein
MDVVEDLFLSEQFHTDKKYLTAVIDFGYSYRICGLQATVTAYSEDVEKRQILKGIHHILQLAEGTTCDDPHSFSELVRIKQEDRQFKKNLEDAAIALKLALRVYLDKPLEQE